MFHTMPTIYYLYWAQLHVPRGYGLVMSGNCISFSHNTISVQPDSHSKPADYSPTMYLRHKTRVHLQKRIRRWVVLLLVVILLQVLNNLCDSISIHISRVTYKTFFIFIYHIKFRLVQGHFHQSKTGAVACTRGISRFNLYKHDIQ